MRNSCKSTRKRQQSQLKYEYWYKQSIYKEAKKANQDKKTLKITGNQRKENQYYKNNALDLLDW